MGVASGASLRAQASTRAISAPAGAGHALAGVLVADARQVLVHQLVREIVDLDGDGLHATEGRPAYADVGIEDMVSLGRRLELLLGDAALLGSGAPCGTGEERGALV